MQGLPVIGSQGVRVVYTLCHALQCQTEIGRCIEIGGYKNETPRRRIKMLHTGLALADKNVVHRRIKMRPDDVPPLGIRRRIKMSPADREVSEL